MITRSPYASMVLILMLLCASPVLCADSAKPPAGLTVGPVYTSGSSGTSLPVYPDVDVVLRPSQTDPKGLQPSAFKLLEQGTETGDAQRIRSFGEAGYGIEAIMAVDCSGSMRGRPMSILRDSLYKFASEARSQDKIGVITFADDTRFDVPFDSSRATLKDKLANVSGRGRETHLYDALLDALATFDSTVARQELIVVSDGHDEGSKHTIDAVIREAKRRKIEIDSVGVSRSNPMYLQSLEQISAQTGGGYRLAKDDAELQKLIAGSIAQLKQEPVATFELKQPHRDGKEHPIEVRWLSANVTADAVVPSIELAGLDRLLSSPIAWGLAVVLLGLPLCGLLWWKRRRPQPDQQDVRTEPLHRAIPAADPPPPPHSETRWENQRTPTVSQNRNAVLTPPSQAPAASPSSEPSPTPRSARTQMVAYFEPSRAGDAGDAQPFAWLEILQGPRHGERIPVESAVFRVGAADDNQLVVAGDATLSGHHAVLVLENRIWMVQDAGSTNGTFVNDQRLADARRTLGPGDVIRMGMSVFRVVGPS